MDKKKGCGTICCVAGWYPKWHKQAGLSWDLTLIDLYTLNNTKISIRLCEFHGLNRQIIDYLFYACRLSNYLDDFVLQDAELNLNDATQNDAIDRFKKIYDLMSKNILPDKYYYTSIQEPAK